MAVSVLICRTLGRVGEGWVVQFGSMQFGRYKWVTTRLSLHAETSRKLTCKVLVFVLIFNVTNARNSLFALREVGESIRCNLTINVCRPLQLHLLDIFFRD